MTQITDNAISDEQAAGRLANILGDDLDVGEGPVEVKLDKPKAPETQTEIEDPPEDDVETEAAAEVETETEDEPAEGETEDDAATSAIDLQSLDDLAQATELSTDDLLSLRYKFKASGEELDLPLSEIVKGYQLGADATKKHQEAAKLRREVEAERDVARQYLAQQHQELAASAQAMMGQLHQELQALEPLQHEDPSEYIVKRDRIRERQNGLAQHAAHLAQQYKQMQAAAHAQAVKAHTEKLYEVVPDFGDAHVQRVAKTMSEYGYSNDEIVSTYDHRALKVLNDLAEAKSELETLRTKVANGDDAAKKAAAKVKKTVPRVLRAPAPQPARNVQLKAKIAKQMTRLKKTGAAEDARALFAHALSD